MHKMKINPYNFRTSIFDLWNNQWLLLTSGDFEKKEYNSMTIAWGSFGVMWNKNFIQIVVRPTRHTYEFINKYDNFTVSAFNKEHREKLKILGSKSGRNIDKINNSGFNAVKSEIISSPGYEEAELIMECKKIYFQDFDSANFLDNSIENLYPNKDYHRIIWGEIVNILANHTYFNDNM